MNISFLGASGTVTGSKILLKKGRSSILIDCGLFQGEKELEDKNWEEPYFEANKISSVLLSHAHLDHCGYLPKICKDGFSGEILATAGTMALTDVILKDSAKIQMYEAKQIAKFSPKAKRAKALYNDADANRAMNLFRPVEWGKWFDVGPLKVKYQSAGHILGASSIYIDTGSKIILYSGDLGRNDDVLIPSPHIREHADIVIMESTYGNRLHKEIDPKEALKETLIEAKQKSSKVLIPAFAVGRSQALMVYLHQIFQEEPDLRIPIYVHSPMTTKVSDLYQNFIGEHNLSHDQCEEVFSGLRFLKYPKEIDSLEKQEGPYILISASGMMEGGPVLSHLKKLGTDSNNILMIVGYQSEETRGRSIVEGNRSLKIEGQTLDLKMDVKNFDFFSAHADQADLVSWLTQCESVPEKVILIHGENEARAGLKTVIQKCSEYQNVEIHLPQEREILSLG